MKSSKKICVVGAGGLARETALCVEAIFKDTSFDSQRDMCFMLRDEDYHNQRINGITCISESDFNVEEYEVVVAVGDVMLRKKIVEKLPKNTNYKTLIHPTAIIAKDVKLGDGVVIMANAIITCNVTIGNHTIIDRQANIGHDCVIEDYVHMAPLSVLSGNVSIGAKVYIGTTTAVRENISIIENTTIGMGGIVVKNIDESGTYVGNPVKKIK